MNDPKTIAALAIFAFAAFPVYATEEVDRIDPMFGAVTYPDKEHGSRYNGACHGCGKTFPGPATPFGQIQLSPDTVTGGDNGPGYSYSMDVIEGFSFLHMSGIGWYGEFGNFQVMPLAGKCEFDREAAKSAFSHDRECAKAGFYSVELDRYGVKAELTASRTCGFLRFSYPADREARVKIDLGRRIGQKERWLSHSEQHLSVVGDRAIEGYMVCSEKDGGWGRGNGRVNYTVYFHAEFSEPIDGFAFAEKNIEVPLGDSRSFTGTNVVFCANFGKLARPLEMKASLSFDSVDEARAN